MASRERQADGGTARVSAGLSRRAFIQQISGLGAATLLTTCGGQLVTPSPTPKLRRIGYLSGNSTSTVTLNIDIFRQTLRELGYVEDRDFRIDARVAEGAVDRLPALAAELIALSVDVLVAEASPAALAAKKATAKIPIVFLHVNDPVGQGMVASLARPGANVTGVSTLSGALSGKRLELLKEIVPGVRRLAVLWNANNPGMDLALHETQDAARTLGLTLQAYAIRDSTDLDAALDGMSRERPDALVVLPNMTLYVDRVVDFAMKTRVPHMFSQAANVTTQGGLVAFGPNYQALTRRSAGFVDKIFRGAHPGDMPVEQPTQFDFVINLGMARTLGLAIPESLLRQATEVVR